MDPSSAATYSYNAFFASLLLLNLIEITVDMTPGAVPGHCRMTAGIKLALLSALAIASVATAGALRLLLPRLRAERGRGAPAAMGGAGRDPRPPPRAAAQAATSPVGVTFRKI
jgi:hypothetical protein